MKIGIFGITANPAHLGHVTAANHASKQVDELWVSPVYKHPFGKQFIDYDLRKKMLDVIFAEHGNSNIVLKELDKDFYEEHNEMIYSYKLLSDLKNKHPNHEFKLVVGEDNYAIETWKKFKYNEEIDKEFGVIVVPDKGAHSTDIRSLVEQNQKISHLVGETLETFIYHNNLYKKVQYGSKI